MGFSIPIRIPSTEKPSWKGYPSGQYVVQNPPQEPLSIEEMDDVYALPYMRTYHPSYEEKGGVPAISEIKFSLIKQQGLLRRLRISVR